MGESKRPVFEIALYSVLFLFFFQLVTDFVAAIYAFGLLATSMTAEIASVVLFFTPLLLLALRRKLPRAAITALVVAVLVSRPVEAMLDVRGQMLVSGIGVGCFLLALPALLWKHGQEEGGDGLSLGLGLLVGLALAILFRALNSGVDLTNDGWGRAVNWALAAVAAAALRRREAIDDTRSAISDARGAMGKTLGLCLGLTAVLVLLYFAFASPNVIARWTGADYRVVVALVALALVALVWLLTSPRQPLARLTPALLLVWNALFVLAMTLTILAHQIRFPADPAAYPLAEPPVTSLHHIPLVLMLLSFPVLLVDFLYIARALVAMRPSLRLLGGGFTLGALFFLLSVFAQVFTTVYDYIPVVGPFFRDRFWLVFLVPGVVVTLSMLLVRREALALPKVGRVLVDVVSLLGVVTVAGVLLTAARPPAPPAQTSLRVLTYNVQQGYSEDGQESLEGQLRVMRQLDADLIGLQESDTNRIAGGNMDLVRYFADRLDMYSYYGPKTVAGTFGIALLSRYPIENARTFYMASEGEQTATIAARVTVDGRTFNVFVTHLGNDGPLVQQEAILREVRGLANVIAMGDFNFRPDTEQYQRTVAVLDDAWLLRWPDGTDDEGHSFPRRIDHVFVSPGTVVRDARYWTGPESDHPALVVEVGW